MYARILSHLDKSKSCVLLLVLLLAITLEIVTTSLIPDWRHDLFEGLGLKSLPAFHTSIITFTALFCSLIGAQSLKYFFTNKLSLYWRNAIVDTVTSHWNANTRLLFANPEQRIQEDSKLASQLTFKILVECIISLALVCAMTYQMHGLILYSAVGYSVLLLSLSRFFHRPMINAEKGLQRAEAVYRAYLCDQVRLKDQMLIETHYPSVMERFLHYVKVASSFTLFNGLGNSFTMLVPILVLVPTYFLGSISLSDTMEGITQFELFVVNATVVLSLYEDLTRSLASYERLKEFYNQTV